jgi:Lectin C-type domain
MKTTFAAFGAAALLLAAVPSRAGIIAGPITNPANGHDYYLLTPNTWSASEAEAEAMGGTLAIVRNAGEQKWIFSTFGNLGGANRSLWIGLHRTQPGGKFAWVDGTPLDYAHWYPGEPNNAGGNENCVHMRWDPAAPGTWNDLSDANQLNAVVEMPAKSSKALTERERALIGHWYESGRIDRPCHIAAAENALFAIIEANGAAGRIFFHKRGDLFVDGWQVHGEVIQDRILWSNNSWWSRQPVDFETSRTPPTGDRAAFHSVLN